jgi:hypothetical protein
VSLFEVRATAMESIVEAIHEDKGEVLGKALGETKAEAIYDG